jgi:hypothetical protein
MPIKKRAKKQPGAAPAATAKQVFETARSKRKGRPGSRRQQPEPASEPRAKTIKKPRRKPAIKPVTVVAEVKSVMHRIFESQREQLFQLREDIQKVIFLGW